MQNHVAMLITSGPEVKSLIFSGFLSSLLENNKVSIFTPNPKSKSFISIPKDISLVQIPRKLEPKTLQNWRYRASHIHSSWVKKKGVAKWRHYLGDTEVSYKNNNRQRIINTFASPISVNAASYIEKCFALLYGTNSEWEKLFKDQKINGIITSSYSNPVCTTALQTAKNLGIYTWVITNSWKDVFVSPHLPIIFSGIFVWRQKEKDFLEEVNSAYPKDRIKVTGSLHLRPFQELKNIIPRNEFFSRIGLDPIRPLIIYTAASPKAVKNEEEIVLLLIRELQQIPEKPQLIIRTNPMESSPRFMNLEGTDVRVLQPDWEWIPATAWCSPSLEDNITWVNLVYHSIANVSIASTVTLEFACLRKPVINICFDLPSQLPDNESNKRFWDAPFYDEVRESKIAIPVFTQIELRKALNNLFIDNLDKSIVPTWVALNANCIRNEIEGLLEQN